MRKLLLCLFTFIAVGCDLQNSEPIKTSPPKPPRKLTQEERQSVLTTVLAQGRMAMIQASIKSAQVLETKDADADFEEMKRMVGNCRAQYSTRPIGGSVERTYTVSGTNCPITQTVKGVLKLGRDKVWRGKGDLKLDVTSERFQQLSELVGVDLSGEGGIKEESTDDMEMVSVGFDVKGKLKSTKHGDLRTHVNMSFLQKIYGSAEDQSYTLELNQDLTFRKFRGVLKLTLLKTRNQAIPTIEIWINGEKVDPDKDLLEWALWQKNLAQLIIK